LRLIKWDEVLPKCSKDLGISKSENISICTKEGNFYLYYSADGSPFFYGDFWQISKGIYSHVRPKGDSGLTLYRIIIDSNGIPTLTNISPKLKN
jgi:hypothetical protein